MKRPDITPGPWILDASRNRILDDEGCPIADGYCYSDDARAIAALPDLLAALETAYKNSLSMARQHKLKGCYGSANEHIATAQSIRAALTKAGYTFDDSNTP